MTQLNREQWDVLSRLLDEALAARNEVLSKQRKAHPGLAADADAANARFAAMRNAR